MPPSMLPPEPGAPAGRRAGRRRAPPATHAGRCPSDGPRRRRLARDGPARHDRAMTANWAAPVARTPVRATVALPGSKSQTNRALVLAALGREPARLVAPLRSRDTALMAAGLRALGTTIED